MLTFQILHQKRWLSTQFTGVFLLRHWVLNFFQKWRNQQTKKIFSLAYSLSKGSFMVLDANLMKFNKKYVDLCIKSFLSHQKSSLMVVCQTVMHLLKRNLVVIPIEEVSSDGFHVVHCVCPCFYRWWDEDEKNIGPIPLHFQVSSKV